jgi:signal transduction histidine kinase
MALVQHELRGREATLYLEMAADIPAVYWDSGQIMQALVNLLLNARDALPPQGGQVSLRAQYHPLADEVVITVTDTGKGVPPELHEKIFEPFFTTKPAGRGTGLGLSVALGIITQHEGQITVANEPAGGATFTVVLPCRPVLDELDEIAQGMGELSRISG